MNAKKIIENVDSYVMVEKNGDVEIHKYGYFPKEPGCPYECPPMKAFMAYRNCVDTMAEILIRIKNGEKYMDILKVTFKSWNKECFIITWALFFTAHMVDKSRIWIERFEENLKKVEEIYKKIGGKGNEGK